MAQNKTDDRDYLSIVDRVMSKDHNDCSCTERHTDPQCVEHGQPQEPGMGALTPPDKTWQEGKTPVEITCIDMLMHVRNVLSLTNPSVSDLDKLVKQIDGTLRYATIKTS